MIKFFVVFPGNAGRGELRKGGGGENGFGYCGRDFLCAFDTIDAVSHDIGYRFSVCVHDRLGVLCWGCVGTILKRCITREHHENSNSSLHVTCLIYMRAYSLELALLRYILIKPCFVQLMFGGFFSVF